jgi:hypothetical protein
MSDTSAASTPPPVFSPSGQLQGNLTGNQGQPPAPAGASPLAQPSPLAELGAPPQPTPPPQLPKVNYPPMPQQPQFQQNKDPPPDAKDYQKGAMDFAGAMAVLGAVAGRFTRAPGGAGLAAFGAALKGWQTGNLQAYENAAKEWEQHTKQALDNNKMLMEKYKLALEDRKMNIDEQMSKIQEIATQYHHQMMYDAAAAKNYTMVAQIYEKNVQYTEKAKEAAAKLQEKRESDTAKAEQSGAYWMSPQGTYRLEQPSRDPSIPYQQNGPLTDAEKLKVKGLIELYGQKQVGKSAIANDRKQFIDEFTSENGRPPTNKEITAWEGERSGTIAEGGAIGRRAGNISIAVQEAHDTVPNVMAAAEKSAGRGTATWNKIENKWNVEKGDENFAYYVQQLNSLINVYGRVISGGGKGTVSDLEHAREMLNPNMPLSAVKGSLRGFTTEIDIAEKAPEKVRARIRGGQQTEGGSPTAAEPPANSAEPSKMSDEDLKKKLGL